MESCNLPFEIRSHIADRSGAAQYIAVVGDERIAIGKYKPGDLDKRHKLATDWSKNETLRNGRLLTIKIISEALEQAEISASQSIEQIRNDELGDENALATNAASHVDDDLIVELAWNYRSQETDFIVFDRQSQSVTRSYRVETAIGVIIPPTCCKGVCTPGGSIPGTVLLPSEFDESGYDEDRLRDDVLSHIDRYVELPGDTARLCVEYVLLSWVFDTFDETPYLGFRTADAGRGKSRALESVGAICYRPIVCGGGSTAAATLRLIHIFGGTLLCDEFDQRDSELAAEITKILNQGFQRGRPLIRCAGENNDPVAFRCYSPKLFALRRGFSDDATESRMISIRMKQRTRSDIPISLPRAEFDQHTLLIRNRLLAYRFAHLGKISIDPGHADSKLEDRANQIGLPLMAVASTPKGRKLVIKALMEQQETITADRADSLGGEVFSVLLDIAEPGDSVLAGDVSREINQRRAESEGIEIDKLKRPMTPHRVGKILSKDLELTREPRRRDGIRYHLNEIRIRQLSTRFGIPLPESTQTTLSTPAHPSTPENRGLWPENDDREHGEAGVLAPGDVHQQVHDGSDQAVCDSNY